MKSLSFFLSAVLLVSLVTSPAFCEIKAKSQSISPTFGRIYWDVSDQGLAVENNSPYLGARYMFNITEHFGVQGNFGFIPSQNNEGNRSHNFLMFGGDGVYHFTTGAVVPYALGGVGYIKNITQEEYLDIKDPYYEFGGGIKIFPTETAFFGIDVRDVILPFQPEGGESNTHHNVLPTFEVGFLWGGGPPPDMDADGVPDKKDKCPGTPFGAVVDERGCPIDTDGDGVFDGLDKCAGTPAGATVDGSGCPIDSDGDGVYDGIDQCPNTPMGAVVDDMGCPKDSDNDGVYDGLDECPGTPAGKRVDRSGCEIPEIEYEFLSKQTLELQVHFALGSAKIQTESEVILQQVGSILEKWEKVTVEVGGHTDSSGSEAVNQKLSQKRAESVRDYLLEHFPSIEGSRIVAKGYGESMPKYDNETKEGRSKNRRVEIKVLNPDALKRALPMK